MSGYPTDCLTHASIQPNSTILAQIEACQAAAITTYCFPPNGTRICTPAQDIPFFWPPTTYHSDAKVALSWDPSDPLVLLRNNTGNDTQDYTPYMFDYRATSLPNLAHERSMKMSILERRFNDVDEPFNLAVHEGPTVVLVQTAEWPSRTSASASVGPTGTGSSSSTGREDGSDDDGGGGRDKKKDKIMGIVVSVVGVIVLVSFWFFGECWLNMRMEKRIRDGEAGVGVIGQGEDLMAQNGGGGSGGVGKVVHLQRVDGEMGVSGGGGVDDDEIRRVGGGARGGEDIVVEIDERIVGGGGVGRVQDGRSSQEDDDMSCHGDPPPKYTP
ncbi:hypothetical protein T440DRAFT_465069 [Plenodomus tracheiphilus IPT5]|uniref:Uncharacterized protein n=1 Tax=Plenodomus tracheiphilus IPT5 TaxID=1408161 RepID=A0A6A7BIW8_9PLEO|nr:hypothetical protein T440DRAFT_465069 [Plenodomus tracheiphilus IPT5]